MPKPITDPRQQAIYNLQQIVQGQSLDKVLGTPTTLLPRDQALVAELSYGLCRWYYQLDQVVRGYLQKPLRRKDQVVHWILLLGLYQLIYSRIPAHAILSTSVELTRTLGRAWAAKLVNGILRRVQRALPLTLATDPDPVVRYAQPDWLITRLQQAWPDDWQTLCVAMQQRPPMTLRLNQRRQSLTAYLADLHQADIPGQALAAVPGAIVLAQPRPVTEIPGFNTGVVSVQDAGAQLAATLLDIQPGQRVLDACAAPGGKTGHILELADSVQVTAVDIQAARLTQVQDNLQRLGQTAELQALDASTPPPHWISQPFDRILLDVPCSATGVIRRHPDIRLLRRASDIAALVDRQAALLRALWPCLQPGGKLLYATCSLMPDENQDQITRFIQQQPNARIVPLPPTCGHACAIGRQTFPGEHTMDGFYYALLTKHTE